MTDDFEREPCGCEPTKPAHYLPVRVKFCPLHAEAPAMLDICRKVYGKLPCTADPKEFLAGHGNWGLTEAEYDLALMCANVLAKVEGGKPCRKPSSR